jgi:ASC-1-like (ASCH) protein
MKLQGKYFNFIKNGSKTYEIRLNDEKRKNIKIGDLIEFQNEETLEKIICEVENLVYFANFDEVINNIDIQYLASVDESQDNLLNSLNSFYSKEEQETYGIVLIKLNKNYNFCVEKNYISKIDINENVFDLIKNSYRDFKNWYLKLSNNSEECYFTKKDGKLSSILILKINEQDSQQLNKNGKILKIRTFNVLEKNIGIGRFYMNLIDDIAHDNNVNYIYVTFKKDNNNFQKFILNNEFKFYKEINEECIYIKEIVCQQF